MTLVVKLGGTAAEDTHTLAALFADIRKLQSEVVLVHGGGKRVSDLSRRLGIEPRFVDGVRITSRKEMELVDMGLAGLVNTSLVRAAVKAGLPAVGVSGADDKTLVGRQTGAGDNVTATVDRVNTRMIRALLDADLLPVMAPVGADANGEPVNINADEAAQAVAVALRADHLLYLSDILGVQQDNEVIPAIRTDSIDALIARGVVTGGMTAKLRACEAAVAAGVSKITIGSFASPGDLQRLLDRNSGSTIHA